MPTWVRNVVARAPAFLTLTALGTLALWGWFNDWRLSPSRSADPGAAHSGAAEVGRFKADLLQDLTQVQLRSATLESLQQRYREGAIPERSLREAQSSLREARIRLVNDQQALLNLGLTVRLEELEKLPEDRL